MARAGVDTRVSVGFRDADDVSVSGSTFVIEQSSKLAKPGEAWFRVHPSSQGISITPTTGSCNLSARSKTKRVDQFLSFSGGRTVQLSYPVPRQFSQELIGKFVSSKTGEKIYPKFYYDSTRRELVASEAGYGTIRVRYEAPYDLWLAKFVEGGSTKPFIRDPSRQVQTVFSGGSVFYAAGSGSADEDDDPIINGYQPMTIIGIKIADDEVAEVQTASLTPTPKLDEDASFHVGLSNSGGKIPKLRLEIDPSYAPKLSSVLGVVSASCKVRLYPNVAGVILDKTSGNIVETTLIDGMAIKEMISFNGNASSSLSYQPSSAPILTVMSGRFIDKWGRSFTPYLVPPNMEVSDVNWLNSSTFSTPVSRYTGEDEVVVTDMFGHSIPAYGSCSASYAVSYRLYTVEFEYDTDKKRFKTIYMVAHKDTETATLQIDPPSLRGLY